MTAFLIAILLVASEALYLSLLRLNAVNGVWPVAIFLTIVSAAFALYLAAYLVLRNRAAGFAAQALAVGGAILFRVTLLPAGLPPDLPFSAKLAAMRADWRGEDVTYERFLLFDDDIWRYLWDGHVAASGRNVYAFVPADPALDDLAPPEGPGQPDWDSIRENVNYPHIPTVYPPAAQMVFLAAHRLAPGSVLAMKVSVVSFDLLAYAFIILALAARGQPAARSILYGWNPLVIKVFAGSGHIDAVLVAALAGTCYLLARKKPGAASVSLGLAIAAKISPIVLLPFLARRAGAWRAALALGTATVCYLPYLGGGTHLFDGLRVFSRGWQFNGGPFRFLVWLIGRFVSSPDAVARVTCAGLVAAALWLIYRRDDAHPNTFPKVALMALGAVLIFSPVVMPWYVTWLLPLGVLAEDRLAIFFSLAVCTAFLVMIRGVEWPWALMVEYGALGALACWEILHRRSRAPAHAAVS
ncbi:MAG TPA: glycosyltransferase 87 family protein [Bryobacteraceae bacterium]|nr:glycosyltransferase 87 family protein [Bryobacteraceae bacterium]